MEMERRDGGGQSFRRPSGSVMGAMERVRRQASCAHGELPEAERPGLAMLAHAELASGLDILHPEDSWTGHA